MGDWQMNLIGYYNENGYWIQDCKTGERLYTAGNHLNDSQQHAESPDVQLSLKKVEQYCNQTGHDIAEEVGAEFIGTEFNL